MTKERVVITNTETGEVVWDTEGNNYLFSKQWFEDLEHGNIRRNTETLEVKEDKVKKLNEFVKIKQQKIIKLIRKQNKILEEIDKANFDIKLIENQITKLKERQE